MELEQRPSTREPSDGDVQAAADARGADEGVQKREEDEAPINVEDVWVVVDVDGEKPSVSDSAAQRTEAGVAGKVEERGSEAGQAASKDEERGGGEGGEGKQGGGEGGEGKQGGGEGCVGKQGGGEGREGKQGGGEGGEGKRGGGEPAGGETVPGNSSEAPVTEYELGSLVEVGKYGFGVVRWMGEVGGTKMAGIELVCHREMEILTSHL